MTLGERCDEIVRLIDETLDDYALSVQVMASTPTASRSREASRLEPPMVARVRALAETHRERLARSA